MARNIPTTPAARKDYVLAYLQELKRLLRDLPGFKTIREIVMERITAEQKPLQNGNWDQLVIDLQVNGLFLAWEGTLVQLAQRPAGPYPGFSVGELSEETWAEITKLHASTDGLITKLRGALATAAERAATIPAAVARQLAREPALA